MSNRNEETGVPFGFISANLLGGDMVHELMYGSQAEDLSLAEALADAGIDQDDDGERQEFYDNYEHDEPVIAGMFEGVKYQTSWLGGALNFWIFESPSITNNCAQCSPCVPGAGDLGSEGDYTAYTVPAEWLTT